MPRYSDMTEERKLAMQRYVLTCLSDGRAGFFIEMNLSKNKDAQDLFNDPKAKIADSLCVTLNVIHYAKHWYAILAASEKVTADNPSPSVYEEKIYLSAEKSIYYLASLISERPYKSYIDECHSELFKNAISKLEAIEEDEKNKDPDIKNALAVILEIKEKASDLEIETLIFSSLIKSETDDLDDAFKRLHIAKSFNANAIKDGKEDARILATFQPIISNLCPEFLRCSKEQQLRIMRTVTLNRLEYYNTFYADTPMATNS